MGASSINEEELPRQHRSGIGRALVGRLRESLEVPVKTVRIFQDYAVRLYFPANGTPVSERLRCAPLLLLVEYLVYRVDSVAERAKDVDLDAARNEDYDKLHRYKARFESLLRRTRAYNEAVAREIDNGEAYVRLENKVTSAGTADHADVLRLAELRPTDVRMLHAMTFALRGRPVDDALMRLLWPVEVLADLGNDLLHYRQDAAAGRFNTYDCFVQLYGAAAPDRFRAELDRYERQFLDELAHFPRARQDRLRAVCARRYRPLIAAVPEPLPLGPTGAGAS